MIFESPDPRPTIRSLSLLVGLLLVSPAMAGSGFFSDLIDPDGPAGLDAWDDRALHDGAEELPEGPGNRAGTGDEDESGTGDRSGTGPGNEPEIPAETGNAPLTGSGITARIDAGGDDPGSPAGRIPEAAAASLARLYRGLDAAGLVLVPGSLSRIPGRSGRGGYFATFRPASASEPVAYRVRLDDGGRVVSHTRILAVPVLGAIRARAVRHLDRAFPGSRPIPAALPRLRDARVRGDRVQAVLWCVRDGRPLTARVGWQGGVATVLDAREGLPPGLSAAGGTWREGWDRRWELLTD